VSVKRNAADAMAKRLLFILQAIKPP